MGQDGKVITVITLPYLDAYIDRLRAHDWWYERSDDPRTFKAGMANAQKLAREAASDPRLGELYDFASMIFGTDRRDERPGQWQCWLTFPEFCEVTRRRLDATATARPTDAQRLAKIVHTLAVALARADPDNRAPQRALDALQSMGLLEATLTTPPKEPT